MSGEKAVKAEAKPKRVSVALTASGVAPLFARRIVTGWPRRRLGLRPKERG